MTENVNPYFLAYCRANGNTVDQQIQKDEIEYPGGRMCGFILWTNEKQKNFLKKYPNIPSSLVASHPEYSNFIIGLDKS